MASVYARWYCHSKAVCAVNLCAEVEPVYNTCTTAFGICAVVSPAHPSVYSHGLFAKCCGGEGAGAMKTETVD